MQLSCPTAGRLREFLEGSVGDAESDQISRHVLECPNCDRALDTLEREQGDVLKELRDGVLIESLLQEPEFEELRNTARLGQADLEVSAGHRWLVCRSTFREPFIAMVLGSVSLKGSGD